MAAQQPQLTKEQLAHQTLCKFIQITLSKSQTNNYQRLLRELDTYNAYKPDSIKRWYYALNDCIDLLSLDRHCELWKVIFERYRWDFPIATLEMYCKFCVALVSRYPLALRPILQTCVAQFKLSLTPINSCKPTQEINGETRYTMIHSLFKHLYTQRPTMAGALFQSLVESYPNEFNDCAIVTNYVQQLLLVIQYIPELRPQIIQLIVERLMLMDGACRKAMERGNHSSSGAVKIDSEETKIDTENADTNGDTKDVNPMLTKMDTLMSLLFDYIKIIATNDSKLLQDLFRMFCGIFEKSMLTTMQLQFVQFLLFYICHFRVKFAEEFVSRLLRICTDTTRPTHQRCFAAAYAGGFVSKAKYLRHTSALTAFEMLLQWCEAYSNLFARQFPFVTVIAVNEAKNHALFYSVCQALFRIYVYHFAHFESMISTHKQISQYLRTILNCPLQPLKYCHPSIIQQFVSLVAKSQSLGERILPPFRSGSRNGVIAEDTFANAQLRPFDEYPLPISGVFLDDLIRNTGNMSPKRNEDEMDNSELDWLQREIDPTQALTPSFGAIMADDDDIPPLRQMTIMRSESGTDADPMKEVSPEQLINEPSSAMIMSSDDERDGNSDSEIDDDDDDVDDDDMNGFGFGMLPPPTDRSHSYNHKMEERTFYRPNIHSSPNVNSQTFGVRR